MALLPQTKSPQIDLANLYFNAPVPPSLKGGIAPRSATLAERMTGALQSMGMGQRKATKLGAKLMGAIDALTPVGPVTQGYQAGKDLRQGKWLQGGLGAALAALPIPAPAKRGAKGMFGGGIRAWHGSPHDFDKFDINKIGTGDGAQSYGSGLYFAEQRDVAEFHRRPRVAPDGGRLYEVEIKADPDRFLDWHSPTAPTGAEIYTGLANQLGKYPGDLAGRRAASEELARRGVPGVKYKDWWDRTGDWAGTHNFNVFDPSIIDIINKY